MTTDRRKTDRRIQQGERKKSVRRIALTLADELEMEARKICAANRVMRVEPSIEEKTIEWRAAQFIKGTYGAG